MTTGTDNIEIAKGLRAGRIRPVEAARLLEGARPQVRVDGLFKAGSVVKLFHVATLTQPAASGEEVGSKRVGKDGVVVFDDGVVAGALYRAVGKDGYEVERDVQVRGKVPPDARAVAGPQPIMAADRQEPVPDTKDVEGAQRKAEVEPSLSKPAAGDDPRGRKSAAGKDAAGKRSDSGKDPVGTEKAKVRSTDKK
jgi:hypothetical protein